MWKLSILSIMLLCVACKSQNATNNIAKDIEVSALAQELKLHTNPVILDVRTPEEVADGNVKGSINVDFKNDNFETEIKKLDREKAYFVYCRSGRRSSKAMEKMKDLGFTKIYNVLGGYNAISNPGK